MSDGPRHSCPHPPVDMGKELLLMLAQMHGCRRQVEALVRDQPPIKAKSLPDLLYATRHPNGPRGKPKVIKSRELSLTQRAHLQRHGGKRYQIRTLKILSKIYDLPITDVVLAAAVSLGISLNEEVKITPYAGEEPIKAKKIVPYAGKDR